MNILFLTILLPLLGFIILAFSRGRWSENVSAAIGVGSVFLAALVTLWVWYCYASLPDGVATQHLWTWISEGPFSIPVNLRIDGLSLTMLSVVIGVGFFIHLYASWYMRGEEGYSRFFAYTNLFIASMVVLVLADNLLLMYLGWEGVGLCSYLLIGFYYKDAKNGAAAMKAFIVTRIGDVFLAIGLFILYNQFGTLSFQELSSLASQPVFFGSSVMFWATLMLLGGALGKSAQLPLHTWLADAMAGPTPVSALIHAATMVTAGVYLIARTHSLFLMSPDILELVGILGAITLLLAGFAALVQTDIKRILAYSTMSQLGYMFLALGGHAWDAAVFHLMTHAFFKALLFLSAGSVIVACHHEQNIHKMGGLYKKIPLVYACFLVGGAALSAFPLVTSGFYSKDEILWQVYANGHVNFMLAGIVGAFLTSLYTFRMIMIVFHGKEKTKAHKVSGWTHHVPLVVLLVLSTGIGALFTPPLRHVLPDFTSQSSGQLWLEVVSGIVAVVGIIVAILLYSGQRILVTKLSQSAFGRFFTCWWLHGWGFDWLFNIVFVKSYQRVAYCLQIDPIDKAIAGLGALAQCANRSIAVSESGLVRWYIASVALGAVVILALLLLV